MITLSHVSYQYPDGTHALDDVSLTVPSGQKVALIGPNGAGKSTLLLALIGATKADGSIVVDGIHLGKSTAPDVRRRVGLVFQDPDDQLFSPTVYEDIAFGPRNLGLSDTEVSTRVGDQLDRFDLTAVADRPPFHLSLGQKRRASIAAALALDPPILLCDEPSSNLDPKSRRELIRFLDATGHTLIVATHDLDMALEVSDRCVILTSGSVVADGPTGSILSNEALLSDNDLELPLCMQSPRCVDPMRV
jgi:cobalt/nickel transport system ATP-binding protein